MIGIGVIGYGYWGPNLVRNFAEVPGTRVAMVSDLMATRNDRGNRAGMLIGRVAGNVERGRDPPGGQQVQDPG